MCLQLNVNLSYSKEMCIKFSLWLKETNICKSDESYGMVFSLLNLLIVWVIIDFIASLQVGQLPFFHPPNYGYISPTSTYPYSPFPLKPCLKQDLRSRNSCPPSAFHPLSPPRSSPTPHMRSQLSQFTDSLYSLARPVPVRPDTLGDIPLAPPLPMKPVQNLDLTGSPSPGMHSRKFLRSFYQGWG